MDIIIISVCIFLWFYLLPRISLYIPEDYVCVSSNFKGKITILKHGRHLIIPFYRNIMKHNGEPIFIKKSQSSLNLYKIDLPTYGMLVDLNFMYIIKDHHLFCKELWENGDGQNLYEKFKNILEVSTIPHGMKTTHEWTDWAKSIFTPYGIVILNVKIGERYIAQRNVTKGISIQENVIPEYVN